MKIWLVTALAALGLSTAVQAEQAAEEPKDSSEESPAGELNAVRHGFYVETDLGVFFGLRGQRFNGEDFSSRPVSVTQPYIGLTLGYDLPQLSAASVFFTIAHGSSGQTYYTLPNQARTVENFSIIPLEVGGRFGFEAVGRFRLLATAVAGYTIYNPDESFLPEGSDKKKIALSGLHVGGGAGVEYVTGYDAITLGIEALARFQVSTGMLSVSAYPRIKYVF